MSWGIVAGSVIGGGLGLIGANKAAGAQKDAANQSAAVQRYMFDQSQQMQSPWMQTGAGALAQLAGLYGISPINYMGAGGGGGQQGGGPTAASQYWNNRYNMGAAQLGRRGLMSTPELDPRIHGPQRSKGGGTTYSGDWNMIQDDGYLGLTPNDNGGTTSDVGQYAGMTGGSGGFGQYVPEDAMAAFYASPGYQFRLEEGLNSLAGMASALGQRGHGATAQDVMRYSQGLASEEFNNYTNRLAALAGIGQTTAAGLGGQAMGLGQGLANSYTQAGNARASGILGATNSLGNAMNNAAWMYGMFNKPQTQWPSDGGVDSDVRLKSNIRPLGNGLYEWEWNEEARRLGIDGNPTVGELAQEVLLKEPHRVRVGPHGYLQIKVA